MKRKQKQKKSDGTKEVKNILIGLSALILMALFYRMGIDSTAAEMEIWKSRAIEAEKIKIEVDKATEEIQKTRKRIEAEEAHKLAIKYTASARAFEIPTSFVMACAKIETEYNPDCIGPFNEREDFQIYKPSFAKFFPASDWNDRQKRYVAGLTHYAICVKIAQKHAVNTRTQILLSLALHNSGYAHRDVNNAFRVAWKHMQRANRMRIWELAGETEQDRFDRGLSV